MKKAANYEIKIFKTVFKNFERIIEEVNIVLSELGKDIQLSLIDSMELNAHADKYDDKTYTIELRNGIIPLTSKVIGYNLDFFKKYFPQLEDVEISIALGSQFIWTQIFTHELGHIVRGHVDIVNNKPIDYIGNSSKMFMTRVSQKLDLEKDQVAMLMEYDADIFSSFFLAHQVLSMIKNPKKINGLSEKTIIELALTSIFFCFNYLCEHEGINTLYPPAMIRVNAIHTHLIKHLSGKTTLSDDELSKLMHESVFDAYSFLTDEDDFQQNMEESGLDHLHYIETHLLNKYPTFESLISKCKLMDFSEKEIR